jgi:hypothetical protein
MALSSRAKGKRKHVEEVEESSVVPASAASDVFDVETTIGEIWDNPNIASFASRRGPAPTEDNPLNVIVERCRPGSLAPRPDTAQFLVLRFTGRKEYDDRATQHPLFPRRSIRAWVQRPSTPAPPPSRRFRSIIVDPEDHDTVEIDAARELPHHNVAILRLPLEPPALKLASAVVFGDLIGVGSVVYVAGHQKAGSLSRIVWNLGVWTKSNLVIAQDRYVWWYGRGADLPRGVLPPTLEDAVQDRQK